MTEVNIKDLLYYLCLSGIVLLFMSLTQEVTGSNTFFVTKLFKTFCTFYRIGLAKTRMGSITWNAWSDWYKFKGTSQLIGCPSFSAFLVLWNGLSGRAVVFWSFKANAAGILIHYIVKWPWPAVSAEFLMKCFGLFLLVFNHDLDVMRMLFHREYKISRSSSNCAYFSLQTDNRNWIR